MVQRSSFTALWPNSPDITGRINRARPSQAYIAILLITGIVLILCLYLYQASKITSTHYQILEKQQEYAMLQRINSNLLATLASEENLQKMTERAEKEGYRPPDIVRYLGVEQRPLDQLTYTAPTSTASQP